MRIPGNFDRWMFNYKEGNLSSEEEAYFEAFMLTNPDFSDDADAWDNAFIRQENVEYPNADLLLKEKGAFSNWRNWAAILILFISIGSGIWFGNRLNGNEKKSDTIASSEFTFESLLAPISSTNDYNEALKEKQLKKEAEKDDNIPSAVLGLPFNSNKSQIISNKSINSTSKSPTNQTNNSLKNSDADLMSEEIAYSNAYAQKSKGSGNKLIKNIAQEVSKVKGGNSLYTGKHAFNPAFDMTPIDLSYQKRKTDIFAFYFKRMLRKLDKVTGYPIALVNLRDPDLVIPNRNILNFNPGFAGSAGNFRIGADYRNQWTGTLTNSQSATMYFDTYSQKSRGGIGGSITYGDYNNGVYRNMLANLYYSPKFALGKHVVFEPALKVTMGRIESSGKNIEAEGIEFERGNLITKNPEGTNFSNNSWFKDYGLGFVLNTDWFYIGGFVDNIAGHDQRIYSPTATNVIESPKLVTGVLGFDYQSRNKRTTLSPFLTYYQHGTKKEVWAGATAQFNWLTIGASYSSNNEYAASVGLKFKSFKLTYQVDMLESEFLQESFVSHNIGIRFNTKNKTIR